MEIVDLWTLRIEHDYYQNGETSDFDVQISSEMHKLLIRRNLIWRKKKSNEWCLHSFGDSEVDNADVLELQLVAKGSELLYVTDFLWPVDGSYYEVEIPVESDKIVAKECMNRKSIHRTQHNSIMKLSIPFGEIINSKAAPVATILSFQTVCKYWEYICIPRQEQQPRTVRLEDTRKTVNFEEAEPMSFMGHNAYKTRSLEKHPLRSFYENIDLALWEIFPASDNKRLLLRNLPFPEPALILGQAPDTIWRILYF